MVQCLRPCTSTAGGNGLIPGQGSSICLGTKQNGKQQPKNYNRRRKEYYLSQTIGWNTASQITLRNCSREAWFSAVLCLIRTKNIKQVSKTLFQNLKKKKIDQQEHSDSWPCAWEGSLIIQRVTNIGTPEGRYSIFILFYFISLFLILIFFF